MNVLVIGANGQIGKKLVNLLQESSVHNVKAMVRKEEQAEAFKKAGVETIIADLKGTVDELAEAMKDSEAIVFTAGSGGHTGPDQTLLIDLDGAVKAMEVAQKVDVQRFIMVSALGAHKRENWNEAIKPYYVAKHYADVMLRQSDLNYTIIRPGGLLNKPGTGKINVAKELERGTIPREDVAKTILAVLEEEHTYRRSFDLVSGDILINEAIQNI